MTWFIEHKGTGNPWLKAFEIKKRKNYIQAQFISTEDINYIYSFLLQIRSLSYLVLNFLIWESISLHCICFSGGCIFIFWILDTLFSTACSLETLAVQGFPPPLSTQNFTVKMTDKGSEWQTPVGQPVITTHFDFILLLFSILSAHSLIIVGDFSGGNRALSFRRTGFNIRLKMVNRPKA